MKRKNNKISVIYFILLWMIVIASLIFTQFIITKYYSKHARIANLLIWVSLYVVFIQFPNKYINYKAKSEKIKITFIVVIIYYIIYFTIGLAVGFKTNAFSKEVVPIIENIVLILGLASIQEYVRTKIISNQRRIVTYIIITIAFMIINININELFSSITNKELIFKYLCNIIFPQLIISGLCTYLAIMGGTKLVYVYIIPAKVVEILAPVFPDINCFILIVFNLILVIILVFYNNYENMIKTNKLRKWEVQKENPIKVVLLMLLLLLLVMFIVGIFPIKPVAVMSNSMVPTFSRGAIVIIKKVEKNYNILKVGDIIEFNTKNGVVIHRIAQIEKNEEGEYLFTTKGDMNSTNDIAKVEQQDIMGKVKFTIPYIGYPSVLFAEKILGKKSGI